jgi:hypothetical protein
MDKAGKKELIVELLKEGVSLSIEPDSDGKEGLFVRYKIDGETFITALPYFDENKNPPQEGGYYGDALKVVALAKRRREEKEKING